MRSVCLATLACAVLVIACTAPSAQSPSPATPVSASASATVERTAPATAPSATASPLVAPLPLTRGPFQLLTPQLGWATINSGLVRTSDGGKTWFGTFLTPDAAFGQLRFVDPARGWAILQRYGRGASCVAPLTPAPCWSVMTTADGGTHWEDRLSVASNQTGTATISSLQAIDDQRAWVVVATTDCDAAGCAWALRRTSDGGRSWQTQLSGRLGPMRFASALRGWIASGRAGDVLGGTNVLVTSDGGASWRQAYATADGVLSIDAADEGDAWILTRDGGYCTASSCSKYELLRTVDGGSTWSSLGNPKDRATCSGGHLEGPLFASPSVGWFGIGLGAGGANVGPGGVMRTTDGGKTWDCKPFPADASAISAADPLHAWTRSDDRQGSFSTIYTTNDGGASWHRIDAEALHPTVVPARTPDGLALPSRCRYVAFADQPESTSWQVDCGASNEARALLAPALTAAGWTSCGVSLGQALLHKDRNELGISETASPDDPITLVQRATASGTCQ